MKRKMLLILMVMLAIAGELSSLYASEKPEIFVCGIRIDIILLKEGLTWVNYVC